MNRIFKVIWSEARNAYVVVSELTKRQSKSCSTKKLLATLIAAGVFSMAGMHAPVSAAAPNVGLVDSTHYAAILAEDENGNLYVKPEGDFDLQDLPVYNQNGQSTGEYIKYYVRNGFRVYIQKQAHVKTGATGQQLVIALVSGKADRGYALSSTQNIIDPLVNSRNENVTTVLGQSLNGTSLNTYIAAVNGGIDAISTWDYIIQDVNGKWVKVNDSTDSTNKSRLVDVTWRDDGNYYYQNQKINIENVYFLKKNAEDTKATPMAFLDSNGGIYTGTVRGYHNEYLMTGQDAEDTEKTIYTYWGSKADDDNTLLANSGITVGQLNKSFDTLEANEQRLADADIKSIKLDENAKTINLIRNDIAGTKVDGGLTLGSGGGKDGYDTYVSVKNTDGEIQLPSGSKVVATASEDKKLTGLSINGTPYQLSKYQITEKVKDASTPANVVKTYNFKEIGSSEAGVDLVDTDTTYSVVDVTSSTSGAKSAKKLVNNLGQEIETFVDTDTDTKYTAGTGITIDPSNNNKISIIPSEVANNVSISYKANGESAQSVSLSKGLNFVQGDNVQISTGENGVVNISATDKYTTSAKYDGSTKKATFSGTNGLSYDLDLSDITSGLGSMSSWTAKVGETTKAISDGNTLEFVGGSNSNVTMNENGVITISAIDTDTRNTTVEGKNIIVDEIGQADGSIEYTVALNNNVTLGSDDENGSLVVKSNVGDMLISNGQIIGDKYALTNDGGAIFANGVISAAGDGTFRAANGSFTVFADGTVDSKMGEDGRLLITNKGLSVAKGSNTFVVTSKGICLSAKDHALVVSDKGTAIQGGLNVMGSNITNVAAGKADTDAVNFGQLKEYATKAGSNTKVSAGDDNISVNHNTSNNGENEYKVALKNNVTLGSDKENGSLVVKSNVGKVLISNGQIIGDKYALTNDGGAIFANGVISAAGDGTFRAANGSFTVFADGTVDSKMGEDGRLLITNKGLSVAKGSNTFLVTSEGICLSAKDHALVVSDKGTAIKGGLNVMGSNITNVAAGVADTDAVNVGQLKEAVQAGNTDTHIKAGEYGVGEDNKVNMQLVDKNGKDAGTVTITNVAKASDVGDVNNIASDIKNKVGNTTVVDAVNNLNNKVVSNTNRIEGVENRIDGVEKKHTTVTKGANVTVTETLNKDGGKEYKVALNEEINLNKVTTGQTVMDNNGLTVGDASGNYSQITTKGAKLGKVTVDEDGKIRGVAAGEVSSTSTDAVNGSQLHETNINVANNSMRINKLGDRVNKVGAGAAALAALHPMDFDPDDKLSFAVGMGNYAGQNAAAIGAFYRPNEKVMMSVGGTYGNDENMVNVGLSFALDRTNNVSNSRTAMAREIIELRSHVAKQDQQIAQLTALVNKLVGNDAVKGEGVLFPDVPENHWAYEYINGLVQAGVIDGYPDGTFGGERSLTRYEYASMLYKAMLKGTILNRDIVKEFESEIARIRVDRISGKDNDANKIERVRVNYQNRDNYGSRIAK